MTKEEVLVVLRPLNREQQLRWLVDLGGHCTIAARGGYPIEAEPGSIQHLVGFNEVQHQIYNRMRRLSVGGEWPLEEFVDLLIGLAKQYSIEGDLRAAVRSSIKPLA